MVGDHILYYAVDHSPSYLWNSATWEISDAVLPFLRPVLEGPAAWDADETLAARSRSATAGSSTPRSSPSKAGRQSLRTRTFRRSNGRGFGIPRIVVMSQLRSVRRHRGTALGPEWDLWGDFVAERLC